MLSCLNTKAGIQQDTSDPSLGVAMLLHGAAGGSISNPFIKFPARLLPSRTLSVFEKAIVLGNSPKLPIFAAKVTIGQCDSSRQPYMTRHVVLWHGIEVIHTWSIDQSCYSLEADVPPCLHIQLLKNAEEGFFVSDVTRPLFTYARMTTATTIAHRHLHCTVLDLPSCKVTLRFENPTYGVI